MKPVADELRYLGLQVLGGLARRRLPAHAGVARGHEPSGALQGQRRRREGEERVEVGLDRLGTPEQGVEEAHVSERGSAGLAELVLELVELGQAALEGGVRAEEAAEAEPPPP